MYKLSGMQSRSLRELIVLMSLIYATADPVRTPRTNTQPSTPAWGDDADLHYHLAILDSNANPVRSSTEVVTSKAVAWTRAERAVHYFGQRTLDGANGQLYASVVIEPILPRYAPRSSSTP